tara:strand:+ start:624 stop:1079 length:456 start_codon:yes stop_codon:yes gene_type:complete
MKKGAAFWRRVIAYIIDVMVVSFVVVGPFSNKLVTSVEGESVMELFANVQSTFTTEAFIIGIVVSLLTLLYWTFLEWKFNQSVGKMLLRIQVFPKKINFNQAMLRNVTKLSTFILVLDVVYMFVTKGNQRFFEKLSNTMVINEKKTKRRII